MIKKVIEKYRISNNEALVQLVSFGYIPFATLGGGSLKLGLIQDEKLPFGYSLDRKSFGTIVNSICPNLGLGNKEIDYTIEIIVATFLIERITSNPFETKFLYRPKEDGQVTDKIYLNLTEKSIYAHHLEAIQGDDEVKLMLKSIRINDEKRYQGNVSFMEVILAWMTFHNQKIVTVPCFVSRDRGVGKSLLMQMPSYLYTVSQGLTVSLVETSNIISLKYDDFKLSKRTVCYDDIANNREVIDFLKANIKSTATNLGSFLANKKGGKMELTNAFNIGLTTNFASAVPLDGDGDRRIYPIAINRSDWTQEEQGRLERMDIPTVGQRDSYNPLIQKILNHLYWVYTISKDDPQVKYWLYKYTPTTEYKKELMSMNGTRGEKILHIFNNAKDTEQCINQLIEVFEREMDTRTLFQSEELSLIGADRNNNYYLYVTSKGLKTIGAIIAPDDNLTGTKIVQKFFRDFSIKSYTVNGKSIRGLRFPLKSWKKPTADQIIKSLQKSGNLIIE